MEQELISIVVPVYRAERYIEETMDCVRAQTYPHWELLLVEDCGPDRSREIIEQYIQRTRRYENPHVDLFYESGGGEST